MIFKRKSAPSMPQTTATTGSPTPRRRLSNLQRASARISTQLENPRLSPEDRSRIELKLASIAEEIETLKEIV